MSQDELQAAWPKLTATLHHEGPIPLVDFTVALHRLAARYAREAKANGEEIETQLYIAEIRKGSVVVDLVTHYPQAALALGTVGLVAGGTIAVVKTANELIKFADNLHNLLAKFKKSPEPDDVSKSDCDDVRALAAPVIHTQNAYLTFNMVGGDLPIFGLTEPEAQLVDNRAAALKTKLDQKEANIHEGVLLVWDVVRNAPGVEEGRSPDKAIIASIDKRPKQVRFSSDDLKERMGWKGFNPFEKAFVVDVKELVGPSGTMAYTVLALHDVLDRDDD